MPRINVALTKRRDAVRRYLAQYESCTHAEYKPRPGFCGVSFDGTLKWKPEIDIFDWIFYVPNTHVFGILYDEPLITDPQQNDLFS